MSQPIELIPVLDLAHGVALHASGGDRSRYAPVRSRLAQGADGDALALARAYRALPGVTRCYVADLDAIDGGAPQVELLRRICSAEGFDGPMLLDAGTTTLADWKLLAQPGMEAVVGLETLRTFGDLAELSGQAAVTFSLDLRDGKPLAREQVMVEAGSGDPIALARGAIQAGVKALLLLDVGRVGRGAGTDLSLVASLRQHLSGARLLVGGGIASMAEIEALARAGCDGVLVATALHQGAIDATVLARRLQSSVNEVR